MKPLLTNQQLSALRQVTARCNDCLPLIEFLEKLGVDIQELRERWEQQKTQAELALELVALAKQQ